MAEYVAEYRWDGHAWVVQFRKPDISTFGRSLTGAKRIRPGRTRGVPRGA